MNKFLRTAWLAALTVTACSAEEGSGMDAAAAPGGKTDNPDESGDASDPAEFAVTCNIFGLPANASEFEAALKDLGAPIGLDGFNDKDIDRLRFRARDTANLEGDVTFDDAKAAFADVQLRTFELTEDMSDDARSVDATWLSVSYNGEKLGWVFPQFELAPLFAINAAGDVSCW